MTDVRVVPDSDAIAGAAAQIITELAINAVSKHGSFSLVLSGGSTPRSLYKLLATDHFAEQIEWETVHVFWGDERCVPPDHVDSNYCMAKESLLDYVDILPKNIHRIKGESDPTQAAREYEADLKDYFGNSEPTFDVLLLGMGDDGHTASLFPHSLALGETHRWVTENYVENKRSWRVTLTSVAINAASSVMFLVAGGDKAERVRQVIKGSYQPQVLPSQLIDPVNGNLIWLLDEAAASRL